MASFHYLDGLIQYNMLGSSSTPAGSKDFAAMARIHFNHHFRTRYKLEVVFMAPLTRV